MVESRRVKILSKKPHGSFLLANIHRQSFNDVHLLCSGGSSGADKTLISSHRLILSSISPLFSSILKEYTAANTDQDHPIVISLPGTDPKVMNFLLDFAYSGKTTVPLEHLDGISETSKRLRIKYLENAIVKVERAPTESVAILKPIKSSVQQQLHHRGSTQKLELKPIVGKVTKGNATSGGGSSSYESPAPPTPVFQPRKRTTKIRKVLIPKCTKGSSTSDLPVVDLEECKSEIVIKNDGSHVQVLRHPASGLVLQPVSQIPTHKTESLRHRSSLTTTTTTTTEQEYTPQMISGAAVGGLAAVSKGFTITSPTVGVGYQGSRVLVQKSRSITLNHDGEEIIHCDKAGMKVEEYEADTHSHEEEEDEQQQLMAMKEEDSNKEVVDLGESFEERPSLKEEGEEEGSESNEVLTEEIIQSEEVLDEFNASDVEDVEEKVVSNEDKDGDHSQLSEEEKSVQEEQRQLTKSEEDDYIVEEGEVQEGLKEEEVEEEGIINEDDELLVKEDSDDYGEGEEGEDSSKSTHCRTSGRVRKMNPKYFHDDNISAAEAAKTPPKETYHRKRSRTSSENNSTPLHKKKK